MKARMAGIGALVAALLVLAASGLLSRASAEDVIVKVIEPDKPADQPGPDQPEPIKPDQAPPDQAKADQPKPADRPAQPATAPADPPSTRAKVNPLQQGRGSEAFASRQLRWAFAFHLPGVELTDQQRQQADEIISNRLEASP